MTRRRPDPPGAVDRLHAGAYDATVEAEGPLGAGLAGARPSDAPNLAALLDAAIFAGQGVLADGQCRRQSDSAEQQSVGAPWNCRR